MYVRCDSVATRKAFCSEVCQWPFPNLRGTWVVTGFVSFTLFGGPNPGTQGGTLQITITLFVQAGASQTGVPITVNCLIDAPLNFTGAEGDTIGNFTDTLRSHTLCHLNQSTFAVRTRPN